jgi:hypothetical protein
MEQASRHPALRTERPSCNRNGQYPHGKRKAAIGEQCKFSALLKMLRGGTPEARAAITMPAPSSQIAAVAQLEAEPATTVGGPTHGAPKMIGVR